jgi:hypothetical protein
VRAKDLPTVLLAAALVIGAGVSVVLGAAEVIGVAGIGLAAAVLAIGIVPSEQDEDTYVRPRRSGTPPIETWRHHRDDL